MSVSNERREGEEVRRKGGGKKRRQEKRWGEIRQGRTDGKEGKMKVQIERIERDGWKEKWMREEKDGGMMDKEGRKREQKRREKESVSMSGDIKRTERTLNCHITPCGGVSFSPT